MLRIPLYILAVGTYLLNSLAYATTPNGICAAQSVNEVEESTISTSYMPSAQTWSSYLEHTRNASKPWLPVTVAVNYFKEHKRKPGIAVDIGAGTGKDTLYLLQQGWHVLATDLSPKAIAIIQERAKEKSLPIPNTQAQDFLQMQLPERIDLVNSYLALPFASPETFKNIWDNITLHLNTGGLFAGSLLSNHDDYASEPSITTLTDEQIKCLFAPYKILYLRKIETDKVVSTSGKTKHWVIWEFVIKKLNAQPYSHREDTEHTTY